jgi:predicted amidohydrolase
MRAHLVQMDIVWEDRAANHRLVEVMLDGVGVRSGDLIVLPELFDVGFSLNLGAAPDKEDETLRFLLQLADDLGVTVHGGRAVHPCDCDKALNLATVTRGADVPGAEAGREPVVLCEYAKVHPFSYGREGESYRGGEGLASYEWLAPDGRLSVCPAVCYDLRFPELFRIGAARGAEAFVIGANWPAARQAHWRALLIARAIENQAVVLGVNRCGRDPHLAYAGGTIAVSAKGAVLGELGEEPGVLSVEVDPGEIRSWREAFPALRDMRLIGG